MTAKTMLSIFGRPWLIEPNVAMTMLEYLQSNDGEFRYSDVKESESNIVFASMKGVITAPGDSYGLSSFKGFDGAKVAVIPISGAMMKDDYCGALGTSTIANLVSMADATSSVEKIVLAIDSPGGSVSGTQYLADTVKSCVKETVALYDMACSAAYWVASACNSMYASNTTSIAGSIGTMISLVDNTKAAEKKGYVLREYYATQSKDKNKAFTLARDGDGRALISEMLDPLNNEFIASVKSNRSNVSEDALTGKTFLAKEAIAMGLTDGISSLKDIVNNYSNKKQIKSMDINELKMKHPELVAAVQKETLASERDRVNTWMVYADIDPKAVKDGIASGENISQSAQAELMRKQIFAEMKDNIKKDSNKIPDVKTEEPKDEKEPTAEEKAKAEMEARVLAERKAMQQFLTVKTIKD